MADFRNIKNASEQHRTFMIGDSIRWSRNGDYRNICQKVGEKWVHIKYELIDELSELIFKGYQIVHLCTEKELRAAYRSDKLRKFLTKLYLQVEAIQGTRIYTIGDNVVEVHSGALYAAPDIVAKSDARKFKKMFASSSECCCSGFINF